MKSKIMKQKETKTVFSRRNYIILLIGSVVIITTVPLKWTNRSLN